MLLLDLPHELILDIWDRLETTKDRNTFVRTCRRFHDTLNARLYHYITHRCDRYYPFQWVAEHGPLESLHKLLSTGINPAHWGVLSPLDPAARYGRGDVLQVLIEYGFDPNTSDGYGQTPLHHAAIHGHRECARMLLDAGADLNCRDDEDYTPSSWAVLQGRANVLAFLLDMGASMDIKLPDEDTPLCFAAGMGYEKLVTLLLERNAAVDGVTDGRPGTPLFRAAQAGHMKIASQLLEAGADIRYMSYGQNSLHCAAHGGYEDVVTLLLENGAVATETDIAGNTPLHRACYSGSMNERVVELLLKENVNVNARNSDGSTPLWVAALRGFSKAACCLLRHGADHTIMDNEGSNPLVVAARHGHAQTVLDIIDYYAPSAQSFEPCDTPAEGGNVELEKYIDTTDRFNRTPLFLATLYGHEEVVRILLSRGSSAINFATSGGRTPLSVAQDHSQNLTNSHVQRMNSILACLLDPSNVVVDLEKVEASSHVTEDGRHKVVCENCSLEISLLDSLYHCSLCNYGHHDMCVECFGAGETCEIPTHIFQCLRMVDGSWTAVLADSNRQ